jgi:hypothetical protein
MHYMQFRIHPSVGMARIGDSTDAYYLASDFPQYLQEEFDELRLKPRPRVMPPTVSASAGTFKIFDDQITPAGNRKATANKFKDKANKVLPQGARFRVFAYVYRSKDAKNPCRVFEVTTDHADIEWQVKLGNLKAQRSSSNDIVKFQNTSSVSVDTRSPDLKRTKVNADTVNLAASGPANNFDLELGSMFLERKSTNAAQVSGRLHLIGNPGQTAYFGSNANPLGSSFGALWTNDWYDSAADGPVEAIIRPKNSGAQLRAEAGVNSAGDVEYLDDGVEAPKASSTASVRAAPAWAVVGLPDYTPDMGHFVSVWDLALSQAINTVDENDVKSDSSRHKMIRCKSETERYRKMDYHVHIHPQMCLFQDVNYVSGATKADPGHNETTPVGTASTSSKPAKEVQTAQIEKGGMRINPRNAAEKQKLADPKDLKATNPKQKIADWLKTAILERLRGPSTLYLSKRKFYEGGTLSGDREFPRRLGRRVDIVKASNKQDSSTYHFPASYGTNLPGSTTPANSEMVPGNLKPYHNNIERPRRMCGAGGAPTLKSGKSHPSGYNNTRLQHLDDMYWPINPKNMPLLRELAYTHVQFSHFEIWSSVKPDPREVPIFTDLIAPSMQASLQTSQTDVDVHFDFILSKRPKHVPAMIDMASMGTMLGGSFLPGIEVGLEAGRRENWTLYHGACKNFPDVRFERSTSASSSAEHFPGRLTKDLAIPWQRDYVACDEQFWPTSRPGRVRPNAGGVDDRHQWLIDKAPGVSDPDYYNAYWKELGFIRRTSDTEFQEDERV